MQGLAALITMLALATHTQQSLSLHVVQSFPLQPWENKVSAMLACWCLIGTLH